MPSGLPLFKHRDNTLVYQTSRGRIVLGRLPFLYEYKYFDAYEKEIWRFMDFPRMVFMIYRFFEQVVLRFRINIFMEFYMRFELGNLRDLHWSPLLIAISILMVFGTPHDAYWFSTKLDCVVRFEKRV